MGWSSDLSTPPGEPRSLELCLWSRVRHRNLVTRLVSVLREGCSASHCSADPTIRWRQIESEKKGYAAQKPSQLE